MAKATISKLLSNGDSIKIFEAVLNKDISEDEYMEYFKGRLDSLIDDINKLDDDAKYAQFNKIQKIQQYPKVYMDAFREIPIGVSNVLFKPEFLKKYGNKYWLLQAYSNRKDVRVIYLDGMADPDSFKEDIYLVARKRKRSNGFNLSLYVWFKDMEGIFYKALPTGCSKEEYLKEEALMDKFLEDAKEYVLVKLKEDAK